MSISRRSRWAGALSSAALVIVVGLASPAHAATTYVVAVTGDDAAAGSADEPFRTISRCAVAAGPGDVCEIGAGVYRETVTPPRSGTAGARITFRAAPGASVTVDGTDRVDG